ANSIASEIRVQMKPGEEPRAVSSRPVNLEAREAYLEGRYHLQQADNARYKRDKGKLLQEESETAIDYFQKAIQKDPNYAPPYIGVWEGWQGSPLPTRDWVPRARPMVLKALQLDDTLADAHLAMAAIYGSDWKWTESEKEFRRAIQLGPSNAETHAEYSNFLLNTGRTQEGMNEAELAQTLDPKCERMGNAYYYTRQFDRAITLFQSQAQMMPSDYEPHYALSIMYGFMGRHQEAIVELQKMITILEYTDLAKTVGRVYKSSGYEKALKVYADQVGALYSRTNYIPAWYVAS